MASIYGNKDKDKYVREDDNGGGPIDPRLNAELNARARLAAEQASADYDNWKKEQAAKNQTTGASGETYGYSGGYSVQPSYSYVPGTFNYNYGYSPTQFNGQYTYAPGEFNGQYGYAPTEFGGQYGYKPTQFQYQSEYADLINAARDRLTNWSYDPEKDVSYNVYKNQYTRAGQQALTDALARYASRTGGVASSYASSAAQQQYNNYMAQLAAKVPELEQLAYGRASDELQRYVSADQDAYNRAYNEYADWENRQRAQADTEYQNAYQQWSDRENMLRTQADTEYQNAWNQYVDAENRRREQANTLYDIAWNQYTDWENRQREQADTEYDVAYRKWQTEEAAREQAAQNAYNAQMAAYRAATQSSGSGKGSGSDENYETEWLKDPKYVEAKKTAYSLKNKPKELAGYLDGLWQRKSIPEDAIDFLADAYGADYDGWEADQNKPKEEPEETTKRSSNYSVVKTEANKLKSNPTSANAYLKTQVLNDRITDAERIEILGILGIEREAEGDNYAGRNRSRVSGWKQTK